MSHLALYRKYRPSGFEHLIGQDAIKTTLLNSLENNTFSHAYVFSGPRGTGKTSSAKLFAKAVNCKNKVNHEPCGKCNICSDSNPDIIEIDAASNNGVDEIRDLRDKIGYTPVYGEYKVYIIDEVHMLSTGAFNALLKTLEEPPKHAIFILATTEPHKIPLTILSRCQRFDFKRISNNDLISRMEYIVNEEGFEVEKAALEVIARISQGGMRDSLSLLDQSISLANGKVTLADIIELTGTVDLKVIGELIKAFESKDPALALELLDEVLSSGKEPKLLVEDVLSYYRDILVYRRLGAKANLSKVALDSDFNQVAKLVDMETISEKMDEISKCQYNLKFVGDEKIALEIAFMKIATVDTKNELLLLKKEVEQLKAIIGNPELASTIVSQNSFQTVCEDNPVVEDKGEDSFELNPEPLDILDEIPNIEPIEQEPIEVFSPTNETLDSNVWEGMESFEDSEPIMELTEDSRTELQSDVDFITTVENDIKGGADYIEITDENHPAGSLEERASIENEPSGEVVIVQNEDNPFVPQREIFIDEFKQMEVHDVLRTCSKAFKVELKEKYSELLEVIKQDKLATMSLFREATVEAVSNSFAVISYPGQAKVKLMEKVSNQSIVTSCLSDVMGRDYSIIILEKDEWEVMKDNYLKENK